jgi:hypothetical protein
MILKVQNETSGFDMWDSLEHVTFHRANMEIDPTCDPEEPEQKIMKQVGLHPIRYEHVMRPEYVVSNAIALDGKSIRKDSYGWLIESRRNGRPFSVFFDMQGFLLNDNGQTIETLR